MNATESQTISVNLDDLLLARDVINYQKEYFRLIAQAKRTSNPATFQAAKEQLEDCKSIEKTWESRLSHILSEHNH